MTNNAEPWIKIQKGSHWGLIITIGIILIATQAGASNRAIAEDPEFRAAWAAYKASTPEARTAQSELSSFPVSSLGSLSPDGSPSSPWAANGIAATTPKEICEAVQARVRYTPDEEDHWQTGEETWKREAGDCEDFAAAVRDICHARHLDAQMYVFHSKTSNTAHAVVIGYWNGGVWMSSNGSYKEVGSISNARNIVIRDLKWNDGNVVAYPISGPQLHSVEPALF